MKWKQLLRPDRKWWLLAPVLLGVAVVAALIANKRTLKPEKATELRRSLRVIRVPRVEFVARVTAYGTARPGRVWQGVSEVKGRVVEVHPQLRSGSLVEAGELLLRIDPAEYDLAIAQLAADVAQIEAEREELGVQEANDRASLEIEETSLRLAERELKRLESLAARNAVSASEVDNQQRILLAQRQNVQRLRNSLKLAPHQLKSLDAAMAVKQASLGQARLDRAKTEVRAPFDCRLGEVTIEQGQFLAAGQSLFQAHGTDVTEIEAQVPVDQLRTLIRPELQKTALSPFGTETIGKVFDFEVLVRYRSGDFLAEWVGRVAGLREQSDPRTRTFGLVVAVDDPYEKAIPGKRPPLVQGMYCAVTLRGAPRPDRVVVPRSAVHADHVYLVGPDHRLRHRAVQADFSQGGLVCLRSGLEGGEMLVVSDPEPVMEGMLIDPVMDESTQARLEAEATGKGSAADPHGTARLVTE
jgi:RND family efflux transporter MFP subunit